MQSQYTRMRRICTAIAGAVISCHDMQSRLNTYR